MEIYFLVANMGLAARMCISKNEIMTQIGTALDAVAANTKPLHAIFIKDFKGESLKEHASVFKFWV